MTRARKNRARWRRVAGALALWSGVAAASGCGNAERAQRASEMAALRGQVEELKRGQETSAREIARLSGELKAMDAQSAFLAGQAKSTAEELARINAAIEESRRAIAARPSGASGDTPDLAATAVKANIPPAELYASALAHVQADEPERALSELNALTKRFPENPLASSAQYWIGETYFRQSDFPRALVEFQRVVDGYPKSAQIPEALLKIGACHRALKEQGKAREVWQHLIAEFPGTNAASQAQSLLGVPTGDQPSKTGAR
jgi:tol-pal system protein YbgF